MEMMYPVGTVSAGIVIRAALVPVGCQGNAFTDGKQLFSVDYVSKGMFPLRIQGIVVPRVFGTNLDLLLDWIHIANITSNTKHVHRVQTFSQHRSLNMVASCGDSRRTYLSRGTSTI